MELIVYIIMRIIIKIKGTFFKDGCPEKEQEFKLETNSLENFNEVAKCIILSGYMIEAYKMFDGLD